MYTSEYDTHVSMYPRKQGRFSTFGSRIFLRQNSQDELGWKEPGSLAAQGFRRIDGS